MTTIKLDLNNTGAGISTVKLFCNLFNGIGQNSFTNSTKPYSTSSTKRLPGLKVKYTENILFSPKPGEIKYMRMQLIQALLFSP